MIWFLTWLAPTPVLAVAGDAVDVWRGPVLALAGGAFAAYMAYRQAAKVARSTAEVEAQKIDAGAYQRARELYEAGIGQLEMQLQRLRQQLSEEQQMSTGLRARVRELEDTVDRMHRQITAAGLDFTE